jgi:uncharacterized protein YyaL (SSP411 family)
VTRTPAVAEPARARSNRLAHETSPYQQQHAENPVDWYPWGEEALARARAEDKPILLSIGYSACHWCHVMAHESFEDAEVAAVMNQHFVNIKVDREERPDLDQIYQTAHQLFNQRPGGWPLTAFLAPDQTPFFVGTYFPKAPRYQLPGFARLLEKLAVIWRDRRGEIVAQNAAVRDAFARLSAPEPATQTSLDAAPIAAATRALLASVDPRHGGFGGAPKFPHPTDLALLLREHATSGDAQALHAVVLTLECMAEGGIYDQLGGGFCRYSVDERWEIPHFEKMLYDNGPLLGLYADAWTITRAPRFVQVVAETAAWIMREMQSPEGGYFSSLDADSEGHEGKFYVWSREQVRAALSPEEWDVVGPHFGIDAPPNFEGTAWHPRVVRSVEEVAQQLGRSAADCAALLASARAKLFAARERRVRPERDDKILTSWNALMIAGMAHASRVFDRPDWLASARRAADFLRNRLWRDGRLLATFKDGRAHLNAYVDDHAFLLAALLELMQADFRREDLDFACALADALLTRFADPAGGFFFTSHDHEALLLRPKPGFDNAMPSGNGVAAFALQRLGHLLGKPRFLDAAERTLLAFAPALTRQPQGYASMMAALAEHLAPPTIVVLRGPQDRLREWSSALAQGFRPGTLVLALPDELKDLPQALDKPSAPGSVNAYVCRGVSCSAPLTARAELGALLGPPAIPVA